jgi:ubiquinone/menaquinone biosynthesis C-methylase UbiE
MAAISDYFGTLAAEYDSFAQRAMPRRDEMLGELVRCLPDGPRNVLELGCGTGALTALLAERYPEASISAIDASEEMVRTARKHLPDGRVSFKIALFEDLDLAEGSFDLVASNMSLHHIADKGPFYKRVRRALRPGGCLVFGDEATAAISRIEELNWNGWLEFARLPGHLSEEEIAGIMEHLNELDHYETLPDQIDFAARRWVRPRRLRLAVSHLWRLRCAGIDGYLPSTRACRSRTA